MSTRASHSLSRARASVIARIGWGQAALLQRRRQRIDPSLINSARVAARVRGRLLHALAQNVLELGRERSGDRAHCAKRVRVMVTWPWRVSVELCDRGSRCLAVRVRTWLHHVFGRHCLDAEHGALHRDFQEFLQRRGRVGHARKARPRSRPRPSLSPWGRGHAHLHAKLIGEAVRNAFVRQGRRGLCGFGRRARRRVAAAAGAAAGGGRGAALAPHRNPRFGRAARFQFLVRSVRRRLTLALTLAARVRRAVIPCR